jgi:hypothetical protein
MNGRAEPARGAVALLVATKKGAWILEGDAQRQRFALRGPMNLGHVVHHLVLDPRDRRTLLMAARTGHLGPTVFRSQDLGRSFQEASQPPAFRKASEGQQGKVVDHVFWLEPGHAREPGVWYAGTSPEGLFRSEDGGDTWAPVAGFNDHPRNPEWTFQEKTGTPDGPIMHSIQVDPRDPRHLYLSMSGAGGGTYESVDGGRDWRPMNQGHFVDFAPDPYPEFGQDPHCMRMHPLAPDVLWMQSHCGIYRLVRPAERWERVGDNMPKEIGDIGFPIVLHPRDPDTAWVFPMDGTAVWPRTSPYGRPAVYGTRDAGKSWQRFDAGLPAEQAWLSVRRQAMSADAHDPVGLYFGTTSGEVWASLDEGSSWSCLARHLPLIHAVEAVELG